MQKPISILMSIYAKENPIYFRKAMNSIYKQTVLASEIVLVVDGEINEQLEEVIRDNLRRTIPLVVVRLEVNKGLGIALCEGLKHCHNEYVARMDTDDIMRPYRLERQYTFLENHEDVVAVGGNISEFVEEGKALRTKYMPATYEEVYAYGKYRNPINHMTVMFRKSAIEAVGSYRDVKGIEDYDLWIRLLAAGYKIRNIQEVLVEARVSENFAGRRGGKEYFERYKELRKQQHELGYTNQYEYMKALAFTYGMTRMPNALRKQAYKGLRLGKK
ncbi:MAG: glycosyltransferase [Solobacterium sp.]|nr:glycosyltransferase [Solobacterium sp.]